MTVVDMTRSWRARFSSRPKPFRHLAGAARSFTTGRRPPFCLVFAIMILAVPVNVPGEELVYIHALLRE
jgi:hypothetical protein